MIINTFVLISWKQSRSKFEEGFRSGMPDPRPHPKKKRAGLGEAIEFSQISQSKNEFTSGICFVEQHTRIVIHFCLSHRMPPSPSNKTDEIIHGRPAAISAYPSTDNQINRSEAIYSAIGPEHLSSIRGHFKQNRMHLYYDSLRFNPGPHVTKNVCLGPCGLGLSRTCREVKRS